MYDNLGRPFGSTVSAINMRQFNVLVNRKINDTIDMMERGYN